MLDILCVQVTKWKESKPRKFGRGSNLFHRDQDAKRNGVSVIVRKEYIANVLEVIRVLDRILKIKLDVRGVRINVIRVCAYAPQVGCKEEEKVRFLQYDRNFA